jgi:hypothetical protein
MTLWGADWAWSVPLILLTVVIRVFGLGLINQRVVRVLNRSIDRCRLVPLFALVMGVAVAIAIANMIEGAMENEGSLFTWLSHTDAGDARGSGTLVADQLASLAHQDRQPRSSATADTSPSSWPRSRFRGRWNSCSLGMSSCPRHQAGKAIEASKDLRWGRRSSRRREWLW